MSKQKFEIGTLVTLRSGSPEMTLDYYLTDVLVQCVYFDEDNKFQSITVHQDSLEET